MTDPTTELAIEIGFKSLAAITPFIAALRNRTKDKESRDLIMRMESEYQTAQAGYLAAKQENIKLASDALKIEHENFELKRKIAQQEDTHAAEIAKLKKRKKRSVFTFETQQHPEVARHNQNINPQ